MLAVLHATRGALTLLPLALERARHIRLYSRGLFTGIFLVGLLLVLYWVRARARACVVACCFVCIIWLLRTPNPTARSHSRVKQIEFPPSRRFSTYWYAPMMLAGTGHGDVHHLCDETVQRPQRHAHKVRGGHVWRPHGTRVVNDIVIAVSDALMRCQLISASVRIECFQHYFQRSQITCI